MLAWEKHIRVWQLIGAILAVPAGVAGTYSVYRQYVSGGVSCTELRGAILTTLDKNLNAETKRTLLRKDVDRFDQHCGDEDPDARVIFDAAVIAPAAGPTSVPAGGSTGHTYGPVFGLSRTGEPRGWMVLFRREADGKVDPNFDGFPLGPGALPPPGTVLSARRMLVVWLEPQVARNGDPSLLQGRLAAGACITVVATQRAWAEVEPKNCP